MGLGAWLLCSSLFVGNDGVERMYMMKAQMRLESSDTIHFFVDFEASLLHNEFDIEKNHPVIRMVKADECFESKPKMEYIDDDEEIKKFPENES